MKYTINTSANQITISNGTDTALYSKLDDALRAIGAWIETEQRQEAEWAGYWDWHNTATADPANDVSLEELDAAGERYEQMKAKRAAGSEEAEPVHVSPVSLMRNANEMAESWGREKLVKMYTELLDQDRRIERANKWVSGVKGKGYTDAQAQIIALVLLQAVNTAGSGNHFMGDFAEKMREQLVEKLSAWGDKAYPLTDAQFAAAVKAAW